ncbi:phosphoribosylaminoimidazolesuccinocarboxamide synthase [Flavobacterium sp. NRK F7]|uniref:phosphoribosylaminoimidazolesuccinocarboxamide synthase n=1 Tax=Flavobacterium sp. NRK F7 TaxID=2954930 RepID=UPI0020901D3D|nr:phosphoribosylaminoimidazolesuccinocarboxamide synthase [Flavobacterium sp. NRK F7]MCO6163346.1 phosphoribosylaminoimidazolesuccinocarboxamide synthase [Flavobacterium sp. NRK F7]
MEQGKKFKTKTGFCYILSDRIVLTKDARISNLQTSPGNHIGKILFIYTIIAFANFYLAYKGYKLDNTLQMVVSALLGIILIYGIVTSINNSTTSVIERDKIKEVRLKKAVNGITRSRFEVFFEDEKGNIKKRLIMLPGSFKNGPIETDYAIKIMTEEKLLS